MTDALDASPLAGGDVRALVDGVEVASGITADNGAYRLSVPAGTYTVEVSFRSEGTETVTAVVDEAGETVVVDLDLDLARIDVAPAALSFTSGGPKPDRTVGRQEGHSPLEFEVVERGAATPYPRRRFRLVHRVSGVVQRPPARCRGGSRVSTSPPTRPACRRAGTRPPWWCGATTRAGPARW